MRVFILFTLGIIMQTFCTAQPVKTSDLVGTWNNTATVADAWNRAYQFFPNGTFAFHFSQYDDIGRVRSLRGKYRVHGDTLYLSIQTRIERVGGFVLGGAMGTEDEWILSKSTLQSVDQESPYGEVARSIRLLRRQQWNFILDDRSDWTYYRIDSDPDFYH